MQNVLKGEANPNRKNIFYEVHPQGNRGDEKLINHRALGLRVKGKIACNASHHCL